MTWSLVSAETEMGKSAEEACSVHVELALHVYLVKTGHLGASPRDQGLREGDELI